MLKTYTFITKTVLVVNMFLINNIIAQQTVDNEKAHRRYWYYRTRMINDFMKIGKEQGACIVLPQRNYGFNGTDAQYESKVGPDQIDITNMYIMALALEYKLLSRNHQDTRETIKELYHMLYTINRLDMEAEQFFSPPIAPINELIQPNGTRNGFMLREDMPKQFMTDNKLHFNYGLQERQPGNNSPDENYGGYTGVLHTNGLTNDNKFSDYFTGNQDLGDLTLVVDKYMSMLTAMMFIVKYIPTGEQFGTENFQDGNSSIRQEATNIANRCYQYLKNKNQTWNLHYQDINGIYLAPLNAGKQAFLYSFPLSRMVCWSNQPFPWNEFNPFACSIYNDQEVTTVGQQAYNGFTTGTWTCKEDNAVFKAWCQAGSNLASSSNTGAFLPIFMGMSPNTAYNSIEWADLLRKVLHQDGSLLKPLSVYGDPINQAPCQGPYNYGNCNHGGWEWSSQDRLEHPDARGFGCASNTPQQPIPCIKYTQNSGFQGNYPGVDYMLLHNLYYEYQNQVLDGHQGNVGFTPFGNAVTIIYNNAGNAIGNVFSSINSGGNTNVSPYHAINYMDNHDENSWPRKVFGNIHFVGGNLASAGSPIPLNNGIQIQGVVGTEARLSVFQNLSSNAHIYYINSPAAPGNNTPSHVTYRAGKEIILEPGFQVDHGSTFRAYVQRYLCNGNTDALNLRHLNDSSATYNQDMIDYESDNINPIPVHYVESLKSDADNHPIVSEESYSEDYLTDMLPLDSPKSSEFSITPNPTTGKAFIHTNKSADDEKFSAHIYDMKGRLIYSYENISPDFEINLEGYSKGIYMIQVVSSLGNSITKKIDVIE